MRHFGRQKASYLIQIVSNCLQFLGFWLKLVFYIYFCQLNDFGAFVRNRPLVEQFYLILTLVCLLDQKRPEILKTNPKAKVTEVVKEIARCWSLMTKDDRMVYKVEAKRGKCLRLLSLSLFCRYSRQLLAKSDLTLFLMNLKANLCRCMNVYRQGEIWEGA